MKKDIIKNIIIIIFGFIIFVLLDCITQKNVDIAQMQDKINNYDNEIKELWENIDALSENYSYLYNIYIHEEANK